MLMRTFNTYFIKEVLESWRQHRYLVLAAGFLFFAILDPLMLKAMPFLLKGQLPPEFFQMMQFDPLQAVGNFTNSIYQLTNIFVVLSLMGILSNELQEQRLVFPYSKGMRARDMVLAKFFHYGITLLVLAVCAYLVNTYYVNILIEGEKLLYMDTLKASLLVGVYYIFTLALLLFVSSLTRKGLVAGVSVLLFNYVSPFLRNISVLKPWIPHTLIEQATALGKIDGGLVSKNLIFLFGLSALLLFLTIQRMRQVEVI